jgi:hypothetical protein
VVKTARDDLMKRFRWVRCAVGVHQGCPFGSLFFCLGVLSVVRRVLAKFPTVRIPSIADDMTLVGPQLDCAAAFIELQARLLEVGLKIAPKKCKAYCATRLHPETRRRLEAAGLSEENGSFPSGGFVLCGAPVGVDVCAGDDLPVGYEQEGVSAVVDKNAFVVERIKRIEDAQAKF